MPLQTETNTRAVERRIRGAFRQWAHLRFFETHFEHGQWWVIVSRTGATYSVCDASGLNTVDGFDFECVNHGEDE